MLESLIFEKFSQTLNKILESDKTTLKHLKKLEGKILQIHILKTPINCLVTFHANGVHLQHATPHTQANVTLTGKPSALLRFAKTNAHTQMLMDKHIKIHGDIELLLEIKKIQEQLHIDWEGLLANHIGDFAANRLALIAKEMKNRFAQHVKSFKQSTQEYVHYEAKLSPTEYETQTFYDDMRDFRRDLDHLEARVRRLHVHQH